MRVQFEPHGGPRIPRLTRRLLAFFLIFTIPIGCTPSLTDLSAPSSIENFPEEDIFWTTRWSARNGIDIYSRPAELVRAAREATMLSRRIGFEETTNAFLGLSKSSKQIQAGGKSLLDPLEFTGNLKGWDTSTSGSLMYYDYIEVLDANTERIDAVVCEYETRDKFPNSDTDLVFLEVYHISLSSASMREGPQEPTSAVDSGQVIESKGMVPQWDVFDGWAVDSISSSIKMNEIPDSCIDWFWRSFPNSKLIDDPRNNIVIRMDSPAPHADQYPRWIEAGTLDSRS